MIDHLKAVEIVKAKIAAVENDYLILDEHTIEEDFGWVIFYSSRKYIETGNVEYAIAGNAPYIVDRKTGNVVVTGTAQNVAVYINAYKLTGNPHAEIVAKIHISGWRLGASAVKAIKIIQGELQLNLNEAKNIIDSVLNNKAQILNCSTEEQARKLEASINSVGFCCSVSWQEKLYQVVASDTF